MKKLILVAIALVGVGVATSRADLWEAHHDLHQDVREAKRALDRSIQRDKESLHQEMVRQRAGGVPSWVRKAEHDTAYRELADAHHSGNAALEAAHREGHYALGW